MLFELFPELWFGPVLATLAWSILIGTIAWVLVFKTPLFNRYLTTEFDSVLCTILNLIFVFLMAFMGSDFHANYKSAADNLVKENAAIKRLLHTDMQSEALNQKIESGVKDYLENVVDIEWLQNFNRTQSAAVTQAILELEAIVSQARQNCVEAGPPACADQLTMARYQNSLDDLQEARDYRLATGSLERQTLRYLLCMFLALNAAISMMVLYRRDPRAAIAPLVMYCASVWVAFVIVVLHAEPYVGLRGIEPEVLSQLRHAMP